MALSSPTPILGQATFTGGTGSKALNLGSSGWTELEVTIEGSLTGDSYLRYSRGYATASTQKVFYSNGSSVRPAENANIIHWIDSTGADQLVAQFTGFSGNNANFNVSVAPSTMPPMTIRAR